MNAFGKWVMERAGKSVADSLGIALHLVDMLLTIPLQLTSIQSQPGCSGILPRHLTYTSQHSIDHGVMTILGEELKREPPSAKDKAMQDVWHAMVTDTGSIKVATVGGIGNDNVNHPGTSLSLAPHASTSTDWCTTGMEQSVAQHTLLTTCRSEPSFSRLWPKVQYFQFQCAKFDSSIPSESDSDTGSLFG